MGRLVACPVCRERQVAYPNIRCEGGCDPVMTFGEKAELKLPAFQSASESIAKTLHRLWGSEDYVRATGHGVSSSSMQALVHESIWNLGFASEQHNRVGLAGFKPDFIDQDSRVIIEVERGKTIDNNMDMLDMWKCHVHPTATHLILVVPVWYQTGTDQIVVKAATFSKVCARIGLFFETGNETNVRAAAIIGY